MAIPLSYNLRNLVVRKTTTLMTAAGIALTVAVLVADFALVAGLRHAFRSASNPRNVLVLRKGGTAELTSAVTRQVYQDLKIVPGIERDASGQPLASLEMVTVVNLVSPASPRGMNISVRGLGEIGITMRDVRIQRGRWFRAGQREIVVGKSVAQRYPAARIGGSLRFGRGAWEVVGILDAGDSAFNGEVWGDLNQITSDFNRADVGSSVLVRASSEAAVPELIQTLNDDRRLNVSAGSEQSYYDSQMISGVPLQVLGILVAVIMAAGSAFAAMNTMYAAVARRAAEIGTLRVLGFSRFSVLLSFFLESILLGGVGGALGCLLALPLNGFSTAVGDFQTFSEVAFHFRVTPETMLPGLLFALLVGAAGGLLPARNAARKEILSALREV
jgi:putative ABC transport system permease protein